MNKRYDNDAAFEKAVGQTLQSAADRLDPVIASRLGAIRRQALSSTVKNPWRIGIPALAAIALITMVMLIWRPVPEQTFDGGLVADMALLSAEETLDFYEDLEFYGWLEEIHDQG